MAGMNRNRGCKAGQDIAIATTKKVCMRCRTALPLTEFPRNRARKDGLSDWCRWCKHVHEKLDPRQREVAKAVRKVLQSVLDSADRELSKFLGCRQRYHS